jgi:hypothetical protein
MLGNALHYSPHAQGVVLSMLPGEAILTIEILGC